MNHNPNTNIETRISNRAKSIFGSFGAIVNDFYLEAGIYFVGGFNAALVAWDIYTGLLADNQPMAYAVAVAIIAFIAVEGLAVYLVGAAAKTANGWLWFFSGCFALFFTYAHIVEANTNDSVISEYITIAIPFFVVVGYWARTIKADIENAENEFAEQRKIELFRERQIEDDERARVQKIEDDKLAHKREIERLKLANQQQLELSKLEAKKDNFDGQNGDNSSRSGAKLAPANGAKKDKIAHRRELILTMINDEKLTQSELAKRLGVSVGTVKNDLRALNGSVK